MRASRGSIGAVISLGLSLHGGRQQLSPGAGCLPMLQRCGLLFECSILLRLSVPAALACYHPAEQSSVGPLQQAAVVPGGCVGAPPERLTNGALVFTHTRRRRSDGACNSTRIGCQRQKCATRCLVVPAQCFAAPVTNALRITQVCGKSVVR
jgi:hypothetical protein